MPEQRIACVLTYPTTVMQRLLVVVHPIVTHRHIASVGPRMTAPAVANRYPAPGRVEDLVVRDHCAIRVADVDTCCNKQSLRDDQRRFRSS